MNFPTWLGYVIKSGEITLFTNDTAALQLKAENNKINLNAVNKKFLKDVIDSMSNGKSIKNSLTQLKNLATELKKEGLTITLSYDGKTLITVGSEANPKLSRIITRTNAIEINNLQKLIELSI